MKIKSLFLAAAMSIAAFSASATPQYTGNTFGTGITGTNNDSGYYLGNNELSPNEWFVRWTDTSGSGVNAEWFGDIVFENFQLGTFSSFSFENTQDTLTVDNGNTSDKLSWTSITNSTGGIDGFKFTLTGGMELLEFNLGSSLFAALTLELDDPGVDSQMIFIGGKDGVYGNPKVLVKANRDGDKIQSFEIQVPAPGALALMGLGLIGISFARRKK
jgi:hypothetical protein